jgi:hypothetical protein
MYGEMLSTYEDICLIVGMASLFDFCSQVSLWFAWGLKVPKYVSGFMYSKEQLAACSRLCE